MARVVDLAGKPTAQRFGRLAKDDEEPPCETLPEFLTYNYGPDALRDLLGVERGLLEAFVHLGALWGVSDASGQRAAVRSMRDVATMIRPEHRWLAREAIAAALDWPHRAQLWPLAMPHEPNSDPVRVDHPVAQGAFG